MILPKIALRNLNRQKRRSILLGSALSFGMFILVVVNGATGGLVSSFQKNFTDLVAGHVLFLQLEKDSDGKLVNVIKDDSALLEAIEKSGMKYESVSRRTRQSATVLYNGEAASRVVSGVLWDEERTLPASFDVIAGSADGMSGTDGIVISDLLAESLGLVPKKKVSYAERALLRRDVKARWRSENKAFDLEKAVTAEVERIEAERKEEQERQFPKIIGEELLLQFQTITGQQNVGAFRIAAVMRSQFDMSVFVDRGVLNDLMGMAPAEYTLFGLTLADYSNLDMKTLMLQQMLKDKYNLVPYAKIRGKAVESLLSDIKKEDFTGTKTVVTNLNNELASFTGIILGVQAGSFGLFLIIIAVVMVGLVNTFRIVVYERTKEIGTMRALGTQRNQVRNLFLLEASFLAVGGTLPGAVLGIATLKLVGLIKLDSFTELALFLDNGRIGSTVSVGLLVGSIVTVVAFTLLAAMLPARKASRMLPAQALRTQF